MDVVLTARWVFPVAGPPIANGRITIRGTQILTVEPASSRKADLDLGNAAIVPGLVNAHTHLDLSGLRGLVPPTPDFVGWLRGVIARRRTRGAMETAADIRSGLQESLRFGTTLLGDIAAGGSTWSALSESPLWAMCFREVLGLPGHRVATVWEEIGHWMEEHPDTPTCRAGVSPHAPYSVHKALIEAASRLWPVCIHLAESMDEADLLDHHAGPIVSFLQDLGVWDANGLAPSFEWVKWKCSRAPLALFAHGNFLPSSPMSLNSSVVYCPRTHAAFGHPAYPLAEFLAQGVRIALGTDSLASNPDLDILAEARFVREHHPQVSGERILRMATLSGAEALGFAAITGSLEAGKSADLVVVPLSEGEGEAHQILLNDADLRRPRRTMWRGVWRS